MRQAGVLLHPTALPGPGGCGSFGAAAHEWISLLARHGVGVWQLLPLAPPDGTGSPYSSPSGSALNPWFLDGEVLAAEGFLTDADLAALNQLPVEDPGRLDLGGLPGRIEALGEALQRRWAGQGARRQRAFQAWRRQQRHWLDDHCLFVVIRRLEAGRPWWEWPQPLAQRRGQDLRQLARQHRPELLAEALVQWQLQRQWDQLRCHAKAEGVRLVGDLPFYVAHDSADVWCHRGLFSVTADGSLSSQSGVPPDYFSETGQLWGTPIYAWPRHWLTGFGWWLARLRRQLALFDLVRLDHFRALQAFWCVPGGATTAEHGVWRRSPGWPLLGLLWLSLGCRLPLIAEDLGVITPPVEHLRDGFALPGMKILQFAFDGDQANPYLPSNIKGRRWVVYTGTHDNATTKGWWQQLDPESQGRVGEAMAAQVQSPARQLAELALATSADLAVVPLQDLLELGDEARFNTPGTSSGNWTWRLNQPLSSLEGALQAYGQAAGRYGRG
ncbi:4-alpha-glucanotransferase [Cyanobium sp. HWJ4-Hawea]|uniref:4-alpha-glucanotransferase n=1 Tax=Cyanobium sp. HWJ4-Hawea TaxID=2823713 RepID=UPI0020CF570B|nr:4-alpha-glucanotransferase [Cyanobium sp. HWJ4-Hawea]MCP9810005.1 4-alpha-glucanotransferase [Cyanobium sp. HWJ4-Hawea]